MAVGLSSNRIISLNHENAKYFTKTFFLQNKELCKAVVLNRGAAAHKIAVR